jgi:hypothetical protein
MFFGVRLSTAANFPAGGCIPLSQAVSFNDTKVQKISELRKYFRKYFRLYGSIFESFSANPFARC